MKRFLPFVLLLAALTAGCAATLDSGGEFALQAADMRHPPRRPRPLNNAEYSLARTAWRYFANNLHEATGLVNSSDGVVRTAPSDIAATVWALMAAHDLGVIERLEFDRRLGTLLGTLRNLPLLEAGLPGPTYSPANGRPLETAGAVEVDAGGIARLVAALHGLRSRRPLHAAAVDSILARFELRRLVGDDGALYSLRIPPAGDIQRPATLRFGERRYAAAAFSLAGFSTVDALAATPPHSYPVEGQPLPYDELASDAPLPGAVFSEPYLRGYIELGWDRPDRGPSARTVYTMGAYARYAERVYAAQLSRTLRTGVLTARDVHQVIQPPYRIFDALYADGYAWPTLTAERDPVPRFAAVATRTAVGIWAIWDSGYSEQLLGTVLRHANPRLGVPEAIFERGLGVSNVYTARSNGFVLAALLAAVDGPLIEVRR